MEHVLMLGNGFDLYYKLPTKYNNFLQIVAFLFDIDFEKQIGFSDFELNHFKTVGDILKAYTDSRDDAFVSACYTAHQPLYDCAAVSQEQLQDLLDQLSNNCWFQYLFKSFNKDVGWIDFEKEISTVIHVFQNFLRKNSSSSFDYPSDSLTRNIINNFDFFYQKPEIKTQRYYFVMKEYLVEYPLGSKNQIIDSEKVVSVLSTALYRLSEGLKLYLSIFAESIIPTLSEYDHFEPKLPFEGINRVITFNYTNTYERLYYNRAYHLHGSTDGKIVLGINPDKYDEVANADTLCIAFKKYYQRVMYGTDAEYLSWINQDGLEYTLMIMGHSLDVTDADIIKELFSNATEITIIYHDDIAKSSYIGNIIKMYGKSGFDLLRKEKKLAFRHVDSDFKDIIEARTRNLFNLPPVYTFP